LIIQFLLCALFGVRFAYKLIPGGWSVPKKSQVGERLGIRVPHKLCVYLDDLVSFGLHSDTRSDVTRILLTNEVERLIREGFLEVKRVTGLPVKNRARAAGRLSAATAPITTGHNTASGNQFLG
jgi:hypothetical protein